jgi:hypothetical protein
MAFLKDIMEMYSQIGLHPIENKTRWFSLKKWLVILVIFYSLIPQVNGHFLIQHKV